MQYYITLVRALPGLAILTWAIVPPSAASCPTATRFGSGTASLLDLSASGSTPASTFRHATSCRQRFQSDRFYQVTPRLYNIVCLRYSGWRLSIQELSPVFASHVQPPDTRNTFNPESSLRGEVVKTTYPCVHHSTRCLSLLYVAKPMAMCQVPESPVMDGHKESSAPLRTALPTRPVSTKDDNDPALRAQTTAGHSEDKRVAHDAARASSPLSSRAATSPSPIPSLSPEAASDVVKPAAGQVCQYVFASVAPLKFAF